MTVGEWLPLIGIPLLIAGFGLRLNPLLVVLVAALATGLANGIAPLSLLQLIGDKFFGARSLLLFVLLLPVIGLLERRGLRDQARRLVAKLRSVSAGRMLLLYFALRQLAAATGIPGIGGQVGMVRPLLTPMLEGAAMARFGAVSEQMTERLRTEAASAENVALFFGEDIFVAYSGVLLMSAFLKESGVRNVDPIAIGLWAIPLALVAFVAHGVRIARLDDSLAREVTQGARQ